QVASGIAGSFLGEALYRMSHLLLERGGFLSPGWRETAAAAISPGTGFNRLAFDKRLDADFSSRNAAIFSRFRAGLLGTVQNQPGPTTSVQRNLAAIDYSLDYGLPGKDGYAYARPFDYFSFEVTGTSASGVETLTDRGLLIGTDYALGDDYRGIWGLYGSYDYLSPQLFRLASTALSLGTTAQWNLTPALALQGTGLVGVGYSATGVVHSGPNPDFNYGLAPQAMLSLKLIGGNRFALDLGAREYFVSRIGAPEGGGRDNIVRADASLTVRLVRHHAIAVKYVLTRRDASSPATGDVTQQRGTIGVYYTWINDEGFGAVGW
ncbi:MAG: DUF3943 domain-containing protein, partial [Burkholderiaceae bacterium]